MTAAIGGSWHKQACAWFNSEIPVKGKKLFDAGCGLGHFMTAFKDLGADSFGCDISFYSAETIVPKFGDHFFRTRLEDMKNVPSNCYDILYCSSTLEHIPPENIEAAIKNMIRITKPGGLMFMEADIKPNDERDMPEDSHVNIQPWALWLSEFDRMIYEWFPMYELTQALRTTTKFPGFPLPDWHFFVLQKT